MMISGIGRMFVDGLLKPYRHNNDGIVRMFEVEYAKDYRAAKRAGVEIDRQFVEDFIRSAK